jgi:hexosaminidase
MPELFGTTDPETGEARPLGIVNMANEKAYEALDLLVGDLAEVFASSPYIHIGTDETGAGGLMRLPEYKPYCEKHGLSQALDGHAHELFLHFIERMNTIVRNHGKQAIAWNDFGGAGTPNVNVPTNVVTMVWTGSPLTMAQKGYPIINCCWLPLYMVPPQQRAPEDYRVYDWNVRRFQNWNSKEPTVLPAETPVMGAQICFWEQRYNEVLPILRPRLPAFAERLWHEKAGRTFDDFQQRRNHTDEVVRKIILPITFEVQGLIDEKDFCFEKSLTVKMRSSVPGTIRYTLKKEWEHFPVAESDSYDGPITLDDTMTVSARLYDADGNPVGGVTQQRFRKIVPAYQYRLLGPVKSEWQELPDFATLKELRTGVTGLMDADRADQINRARFAQIQPVGHVDVCVHDQYNPRITALTGQLRLPEDGEYSLKMKMGHGVSELHIGGEIAVTARGKGREFLVVGKVKAGTYPLVIKHFFNGPYNDLNIRVKEPGSEEFAPFEEFVLPISDWVDEVELTTLPADGVFLDPVKKANMNLATDKPVTTSGESQGPNIAANAVDGVADNSSGWHCGSYPQWLQVDLGRAYSVGRIKLYTYYDGRRSYQYTIEASKDGKNWTRIVDMTKNVAPTTKEGDHHSFDPVEARYIRVNMLRNSVNPGVHINELMVYEAD